MAPPRKQACALPSRDERVQGLMDQLRPKMEEALRHLVERAVDVPEHEEFGAIEYEFRDAGLQLANEVRQASLASRKKRGTQGAASPAPRASGRSSSIPTSSAAW